MNLRFTAFITLIAIVAFLSMLAVAAEEAAEMQCLPPAFTVFTQVVDPTKDFFDSVKVYFDKPNNRVRLDIEQYEPVRSSMQVFALLNDGQIFSYDVRDGKCVVHAVPKGEVKPFCITLGKAMKQLDLNLGGTLKAEAWNFHAQDHKARTLFSKDVGAGFIRPINIIVSGGHKINLIEEYYNFQKYDKLQDDFFKLPQLCLSNAVPVVQKQPSFLERSFVGTEKPQYYYESQTMKHFTMLVNMMDE